jgi:hypothetical protein
LYFSFCIATYFSFCIFVSRHVLQGRRDGWREGG